MIKYYNRQEKKYEVENVAGEKILKWTYESPLGKSLLELLIKRKVISSLYGKFCDSKMSKSKVDKFIKEFNIDMDRFHVSESGYCSFNEFFYRNIKNDKFFFEKDKNIFISPADSKLLALKIDDKLNKFKVKGFEYSIKELLKSNKLAKEYEGGMCLIFRLCPTDYHRFHFVDNGVCMKNTKIKGKYYSVNPIALEKVSRVLVENKREYSVFKSENFNDITYIEVGATCVGSIIQTYNENEKIKKGDEKGYFKFGGSTVILLVKKDEVIIDSDIIKQSELGIETAVYVGESIGKKDMHN